MSFSATATATVAAAATAAAAAAAVCALLLSVAIPPQLLWFSTLSALPSRAAVTAGHSLPCALLWACPFC